MNQDVNQMTALGGTLIILGFISLMFYEIAYITPMIFISGAVFMVAGILAGENK